MVDLIRKFRGLFRNRSTINNWHALFLSLLSSRIFGINKSEQYKVELKQSLVHYIPHADLRRVVDLFSVSIADICFGEYKKSYGHEFVVHEGEVVVDIGAHLGRFCLPTFKKYPNIRMYAFEPDSTNYNCLLRSLNDNDFDDSKFKIENVAVYSKEGYFDFSIGPESSQGSLSEIGFFLNNPDANSLAVKTKTLETIFKENKIERCKLLKIDCEGSF